jgi:zinc protease
MQTINTMMDIIKKMQINPAVTDEELSQAKNSIRNSFIFQFETKFETAKRKAILDYHSYPPDYLETYLNNIDKVTKVEVEEAAKKYLDPEDLFVLVIGNEKELRKGLRELGMGEPVILTMD